MGVPLYTSSLLRGATGNILLTYWSEAVTAPNPGRVSVNCAAKSYATQFSYIAGTNTGLIIFAAPVGTVPLQIGDVVTVDFQANVVRSVSTDTANGATSGNAVTNRTMYMMGRVGRGRILRVGH